MNPAIADLIATVRQYKILSAKGSIPNELSQLNPVALGFFLNWFEEHTVVYKWLSSIDLNPVFSILHKCWIKIFPFLSCRHLPAYKSIGLMPLHRKLWHMIIRDEYVSKDIIKKAKLIPELIPSDLIMYMLVTDTFEDFVWKNKEEILSQLTKAELYYASTKWTWFTEGQE